MPISMNDLANVQISAGVTGTEKVQGLTSAINSVGTAQQSLAATQDKLTAAQARFINSLEQTHIRLTKTKSEQLALKAEMLGVTAQTETMRAALVHAGVDGEHSFKHMIQSGGVFRELLVLIHESVIMGNWSRFGGSMMVLAERTGMSAAIFTTLGVAVLGSVAALGAYTAAAIEGEIESSKLARALSLTGGMAGITEGQFNTMAESIGQQIPGGVLTARNALLALVSTGQFTGAALASVGRAAVEFSQYSGDNAQKSVEFFAEMKDGVAKWAAKANEQYHFLSLAQYDYIASLERQGQVEAAQKAVADDFFNHIQQTGTENLGYLERAVNAVTNGIKGMWDALEGVGRATTIEDQLAARIQQDKQGYGRYGTGKVDPNTDPKVAELRKQVAAAEKAAADKARADQTQQLGIEASNKLSTTFAAPADKLKQAIADYNTAISQALAADPSSTKYRGLAAHDASYRAEIARLTKEYGDHSSRPSNSGSLHSNALPAADPERLQTQLSIMEQYARATHQSEAAVLRLEVAQGKLKGFTAGQIQQLQDLATRHDQLVSAQEEVALQSRYGNELTRLLTSNDANAKALHQLQTYGAVSRPNQLDLVNLAASQGDLKGITPQDLAQLRAQASTSDQLTTQIDQVKRSSTFGTQNAFSSYIDQATNAGDQVKKIWGDTFTGMQNLLVTALEGGKVSFRDFAASIVSDMLKMQVEENIMAPLVRMLGGVGGGTNGSGLPGILGGAGGSIIGGIMSGFGSGRAMSTASLVAHQGGTASWLQTLGSLAASYFANGGIMTSRGSIPLNMYANGGVANSPQMAVFGEGRGPEAYVPLPDGRSIPVNMKGASGGGVMNNVTNHITINSDGSSQVTTQDATRMSRGLTYAIQQELIKQARDGGILSSTGGVFSRNAFA